MSEEKTVEFKCAACETPCTSSVEYSERDRSHNEPDACLFKSESAKCNWKRVEQEQPKQEVEEQCCDCRFYKANPDGEGPNCRRFPPSMQDIFKSAYPRTCGSHWCGEFQS